jgi:hypothetical protein
MTRAGRKRRKNNSAGLSRARKVEPGKTANGSTPGQEFLKPWSAEYDMPEYDLE